MSTYDPGLAGGGEEGGGVRNLRLLDQYRDSSPAVLRHFGWAGDETCGTFVIPSPIDSADLRVVASCGEGWDHVSVSRRNRTPNYPELQHVFKLFFEDHETAMQLHVPAEDHVNCHPNCLHLWRPQDAEIPRPPSILVGPSDAARPGGQEGGDSP